MLTHLECRRDKFPPIEGEDQLVNPGVWGKRLAYYLREGLHREGIEAGRTVRPLGADIAVASSESLVFAATIVRTITSGLPVIRPRLHSSRKRPLSSRNPTIGFSSVNCQPLNSRRALISEQDARSVNQILFIAKHLNQFIGKWRDFALQILG
jgi:hypothetical protein